MRPSRGQCSRRFTFRLPIRTGFSNASPLRAVKRAEARAPLGRSGSLNPRASAPSVP